MDESRLSFVVSEVSKSLIERARSPIVESTRPGGFVATAEAGVRGCAMVAGARQKLDGEALFDDARDALSPALSRALIGGFNHDAH